MALLGVDDIAFSGLRGVEITTVRQKRYDMGTLAVKILVDRIENRGPARATQMILEPEIIIRNSCGYKLFGYRHGEHLAVEPSGEHERVSAPTSPGRRFAGHQGP